MDTKAGVLARTVLVQTALVPLIAGAAVATAAALVPVGNTQQVAQLPQTQTIQIQTMETGCRQSNSTTGIYAQPSLDSTSRGILNRGQTVRLELVGSGTGTGWARIAQPVVGWVEAKYLAPSTCTGLTSPLGELSQVQPVASQPAAVTKTVKVTCNVLPSEGLVVRSQPMVAATALYTIPQGSYQFEFTNNHLTTQSGNQERHWTYITAPYQGWISLGVTGGSLNLGGQACG
jgi:hypothetical protein